MSTPGIVEAFDAGEDRLVAVLADAAVDEFAFQGGEEALDHRVVERATDRAHGALGASGPADPAELGARVLGGINRLSQRLANEGAVTSVGSRGDSCDNALAESVNGV